MDCRPPGSSVRGNSPGQNTGVGSRSLLQGSFPTQGLNTGLLHCKQILYPAEPQGKPEKCTFNKFPGEADIAGPGTTLWEPFLWVIFNRGSGGSQNTNTFSLYIGIPILQILMDPGKIPLSFFFPSCQLVFPTRQKASHTVLISSDLAHSTLQKVSYEWMSTWKASKFTQSIFTLEVEKTPVCEARISSVTGTCLVTLLISLDSKFCIFIQ